EAWGQVGGGEVRELDPPAVLREDEDLPLVTIGDEERAAGAEAERGDDGPLVHDLLLARRRHAHDLTWPLLVRRLGAPVAADVQIIAVVDREQPRPGDRGELRIEQASLGIEPDDRALGAVGDVEVTGRIDRRRLGLPEGRLPAALGRAAREELGPPVDDAIERAHLSLPIEGRHEELAPPARGAYLRVEQRRAVEISVFDVGAQARAARRNPVDRPEIVGLAAGVAPARARQVEEPGRIERERGGRGATPDAARPVAAQSLPRP